MRVLIVSQYFKPESFQINEVSEILAAKGLQVDVLTGKPNYPGGSIFVGYRALGCLVQQLCGATVYRLPVWPRGQKAPWRLAINYLSFVASGIFLGPWVLRKREYDVVFVYGVSPITQAIPAILLAKLKGCKVVLWVQDLWPESLQATGYIKSQALLSLVGKLVRWIYRRCDLILISSRPFEAAIRKMNVATPVVYHPNSVSSSFADPSMGPQVKLPILEEGFAVVFAGNIGSAQSMPAIAGAAGLLKDLREVKFVIIGSGSELPWLETQKRQHNLDNLYLPGRFPPDAMPSMLAKASVLLVSLTDQPIFSATVPNKLQAYLATGRPIIASINGEGARLVEESGAGLSAPAGDAPALANAVRRLFEMPQSEREQLGRNGRAYYLENFEQDKLASKLIEYFRSLSHGKSDENSCSGRERNDRECDAVRSVGEPGMDSNRIRQE